MPAIVYLLLAVSSEVSAIQPIPMRTSSKLWSYWARGPDPYLSPSFIPPVAVAASCGYGTFVWRTYMHDLETTVVDLATLSLSQAKFRPGQIVSTPATLEAMKEHQCSPLTLLARHLSGDWGSVCAQDAESNEEALQCGLRLLSSYEIAPKVTIWLITEADRSVTTFLRPSEY